VDEVVEVYRWLLDHGTRPEHIAVTGDSCGGGLAMTAQLRARSRGLPLPAAAMPFSPWVDLGAVGDSYTTNRDRDAFFRADLVRELARTYLGPGGDVRDPSASPLHADLRGLPPVYIQVGGDEVLLDDARRLAEHARQAGVEVRIDVFPELQHTFQMAAGRAPEADAAIAMMAAWVRPRLGLTTDGHHA
jgi:acetyl esterase/lipase